MLGMMCHTRMPSMLCNIEVVTTGNKAIVGVRERKEERGEGRGEGGVEK